VEIGVATGPSEASFPSINRVRFSLCLHWTQMADFVRKKERLLSAALPPADDYQT